MLKKIISISLNFYKKPYFQWHKQNKYGELPIGQLLFGIPIVPLPEGNGRSTRIWLDIILKKELNLVVDWSLVDKDDYLPAMERSPVKDVEIKHILRLALTDRIYG